MSQNNVQKIPKSPKGTENGDAASRFCFGEFELNLIQRRLLKNGETVPLYSKSFDLLAFLIERSNETVTKDEILEAVWPGQFVEEANLSVQVSALRKALAEDRKSPRFLITVPGKGYKFVGDVIPSVGNVTIERRLVTRISAESVTERSWSLTSILRSRVAMFAVAAALVGGIAFGAFSFYSRKNVREPFRRARFTRLTNSGNIAAAAFSPDGKTFAYVKAEPAGNSLWLRQVGGAAEVQLLPPGESEFWAVSFSPDGEFVHYNLFRNGNADIEHYRIRSLGGISERIPEINGSDVAFSPDGKRLAYVRPNSAGNENLLITVGPDGSSPEVLARKAHPSSFMLEGRPAAWSPNGSTIAVVVNDVSEGGSFASVALIDAKTGAESQTAGPKWHEITRLEWIKDSKVLMLTGKPGPTDTSQIWKLDPANGSTTRLNNDLNDYGSLNSAVSSGSFIAVQRSVLSTILAGPLGGDLREFKEIIRETSELRPIEWATQDRLVFVSRNDGGPDIWAADTASGERTQLTRQALVDDRGLCVSSYTGNIISTSWRSGNAEIWRSGPDGRDQEKLSDGAADVHPRCSVDGRSIAFQRGIFSRPEIWIANENGEPQRIVERGKWPVFMGQSNEISYLRMVDSRWMILRTSPGSNKEDVIAEVPQNFTGHRMIWNRDANRFYFVGSEGGFSNIWEFDVAAKRSRRVTAFDGIRISDFAISPDQKRIAVVIRQETTDAVLIDDAPAG